MRAHSVGPVARHARAVGALRRFAWPVAGAAVALVVLTTLLTVHWRGGDRATTAGAAASAPLASDATATDDASPTASPPAASGAPVTLPPGVQSSPGRTTPGSGAAGAAAPARFGTVAARGALPSGGQCAGWVRARPSPENKGANRRANQTTGHRLGAAFFSGDDARANTVIGPRVDGQFTGTTREILRWAACKWGVDEDLVLAQAAIESWWVQGTLGDWTGDAARCAPGRGLGADGKAGQCPESFGILQNRYPYEQSGWPGMANSTAMNADLAYAIWRVCFEGYEGWLNTVERGRDYAAGDAWGCVGRWFSGRWHTGDSEQYAGRVRGYLDQRIWDTPNFQQP
jgi:hypothetical protein